MIWLYRIQRIFFILFSTLCDRIAMHFKNISCGVAYRSCGRVLMINRRGRGGIVIGKNVNINSLGTRNPGLIEGKTMLIATSTGQIIIGDKVGMSNCVFYSECGITVGDEVTIGAGTKIIDTDGNIPFYNHKKKSQGNSPITIGNRVFIGGNVILLKGVTIGDEAVIGSGSVVTHDVGKKEIWAGNPAKFIKIIK